MAFIIAHRGNGSKYKGNTKEAILTVSTYEYVDGVEIDVRMTKDKKFILSHSGYLLTDRGSFMKISNTPYAQIKKEKNITRLEDVLKDFPKNKTLFLDLKIGKDDEKYLSSLLRTMKKYAGKYFFCSFDYAAMQSLKKKNPTLSVGFIKGYYINIEKEKGNLDFCITHYKDYKNEEGIWTVNKREVFEKFSKKDIWMITDHPEFNKLGYGSRQLYQQTQK